MEEDEMCRAVSHMGDMKNVSQKTGSNGRKISEWILKK
jgi:hypothetical protein